MRRCCSRRKACRVEAGGWGWGAVILAARGGVLPVTRPQLTRCSAASGGRCLWCGGWYAVWRGTGPGAVVVGVGKRAQGKGCGHDEFRPWAGRPISIAAMSTILIQRLAHLTTPTHRSTAALPHPPPQPSAPRQYSQNGRRKSIEKIARPLSLC